MKQVPTAVIYTRVSTEEQAENGTSLDTQRQQCLARAQVMGTALVRICEDAGVSGTRYQSRPGIQEALGFIERGEAQVLIVSKIDRVGRNARVVLDIAERVDRAGGQLITCDGQVYGGTAGKMMLTMLAMIAEMERNTTRERTMGGSRARLGKGIQTCRAARPIGYHIVTHDDVIRGTYPADMVGKYVVLENEARWVREIFARYARGESLNSLCHWLTAEGVPPHMGGRRWYPASVRGILVNPVHKGQATVGKSERLTDESRIDRGYKRDSYARKIAEPKWTLSVPALVDEATWNACQERLGENQRRASGNPDRRHPLTGLVFCPACGLPFMTHGSPRRYTYYGCRNHRKQRQPKDYCAYDRVHNGRDLENAIVAALRFVADQPDQFVAAVRAYDHFRRARALNAENPEDVRVRLTATLEALAKRERATVQAQIEGIQAGASVGAYMEMFAQISRDRADVEARLALVPTSKNLSEHEDTEETGRSVTKVMAAVETTLAASDVINGAERNGIYASIIKEVRPEGNEYVMRLHGDETVKHVRMRSCPMSRTARWS